MIAKKVYLLTDDSNMYAVLPKLLQLTLPFEDGRFSITKMVAFPPLDNALKDGSLIIVDVPNSRCPDQLIQSVLDMLGEDSTTQYCVAFTALQIRFQQALTVPNNITLKVLMDRDDMTSTAADIVALLETL